MKRRNLERNMESSGIIGQTEFSVQLGPELLEILSGLYSDIPWALVREYVSNARDGHVKLRARGIEPPQPIDIHVPNRLEPWFSVRDYGVGMDHDTVWLVFSQYGNSTKNDNNDEIGGLGIGAKAAFSYEGSDQWTITAYHDGKQRTYIAARNERGMPTLTLLVDIDTSEPNGVEIKIPVSPNDVERFRDRVSKWCRRFQEATNIIGDREGVRNGDYNPLEYDKKTDEFGWRPKGSGERGIMAVMGGVPYPVDIYAPELGLASSTQKMFDKQGSVDVFFGIGELDIIPSREGLKYTPHTVGLLTARLAGMFTDTVDEFLVDLKAQDTIWEAFQFVQDHADQVQLARSTLGGNKDILWRKQDLTGGLKIDLSVDDIVAAHKGLVDQPTNVRIIRLHKGWRGIDRIQPDLVPSDTDLGVIDPVTNKPKKAEHEFWVGLEDMNAERFWVGDIKGSIRALRRYMKDTYSKYRGANYVHLILGENLNSARIVKVLRGLPVLSVKDKCAHLISDGQVIGRRAPAALRHFNGGDWLPTEVDLKAGGLFVKLVGGELDLTQVPKDWPNKGAHAFRDLVSAGASLGLFDAKRVIGVPKTRWGSIEKLDDWDSFWDVHWEGLKKRARHKLPKSPESSRNIKNSLRELMFVVLTDYTVNLPSSSPVQKLRAAVDKWEKKLDATKDRMNIFRYIAILRKAINGNVEGPTLKAEGIDIQSLEGYNDWLKTRYPLVDALVRQHWNPGHAYQGRVDALTQYIALVDDHVPVTDQPTLT